MGSQVNSPNWDALILLNSPMVDQYWTISCGKTSPVVLLLKRDNQMFKSPWETGPERMEQGWWLEVVHTGKHIFLPNRLLGRRAADMEVIAWATVQE